MSYFESGPILDEIKAERRRQDAKWGEQNHPDGTGGLGRRQDAEKARAECQRQFAEKTGTWVDILDEEVAEAYAECDPVKLRAELVQVGAVVVAWIEAIDRRPLPASECEKIGDRPCSCFAARYDLDPTALGGFKLGGQPHKWAEHTSCGGVRCGACHSCLAAAMLGIPRRAHAVSNPAREDPGILAGGQLCAGSGQLSNRPCPGCPDCGQLQPDGTYEPVSDGPPLPKCPHCLQSAEPGHEERCQP